MSRIPEQLWWTKKDSGWSEVKDGLFDVKSGATVGTNPYAFGIIVDVRYERSETYFYGGSGPIVLSGSTERIFNCILDEGKHAILIITRTDPDHPPAPNVRQWQQRTIEVEVKKRDSSTMGIISNFFRSKTAGQYMPGSTGLDVAFSIATSENPRTLEWFFDKDGKKEYPNYQNWPYPQARAHYTEHYTYKKDGNGYVRVIDNKGNEGKVEFSIVIGDNKKS